MQSGSRVTLTVFLTLLFGVFSNALVNAVSGNGTVHWVKIFSRPAFYVLLILGLLIVVLSRITAQESDRLWASIEKKMEAVQSQGYLGAAPTPTPTEHSPSSPQSGKGLRILEFTPKSSEFLKNQADSDSRKIMAVLKWLQYADPSEIVMKNNIVKTSSEKETDFLIRIGNIRVSIDIDLKKQKLVVKEIRRKTNMRG